MTAAPSLSQPSLAVFWPALLLFTLQVIGFIYGLFIQQFGWTVYIMLAGFALSCLVCLLYANWQHWYFSNMVTNIVAFCFLSSHFLPGQCTGKILSAGSLLFLRHQQRFVKNLRRTSRKRNTSDLHALLVQIWQSKPNPYGYTWEIYNIYIKIHKFFYLLLEDFEYIINMSALCLVHLFVVLICLTKAVMVQKNSTLYNT